MTILCPTTLHQRINAVGRTWNPRLRMLFFPQKLYIKKFKVCSPRTIPTQAVRMYVSRSQNLKRFLEMTKTLHFLVGTESASPPNIFFIIR